MCLPLQSRESAFLCRGSQSELYDLRGRARIARSQWMLPSRVLAQNQSVEVKFNGALSLFLGSGLSTIWDGLREQDSNVKVNECQILFLNGLFHLETKTADFNNLHDHLTLWQKSVENNAKMELAILFKDYGIFQITSQSDSGDAVNCFADTEFLIDKPILARNIPVHPRSKKSIYAKVLTKDSRSLLIIDNDLLTEDNETDPTNFYYAAPKVKKYQFALENAYFTTSKEKNLYLNAKYDQFNHLYEGNLMLTFYILNLLPTLPHPYTSNSLPNIDIRDDDASGNLQAITSWTTTQEETLAEVTFKMKHTFSDVEKVAQSFTDKEALMVRNNGTHIQNSFLLFDVSTQSDHWGIALTFQNEAVMRKLYNDDVNITSENVVTINKNYLQAPMGFLSALTLPQVSWEPVNNITPPTTPVDPETGILEQINNPIPTIFSQFDNKLIKIHPKDYMKNFQFNLKSAQNAGNKKFDSKILFTLPNGKYSLASLNPYTNETMYNENHLDFIMPDFEVQNRKLRGGIQFRIAAYKDPNPDAPPRMTGRTHQLKTIVNAPGISILGETVTNIFNNVFDPSNSDIAVGVPITHIDFSGYGASTFSNWKNPLVKFASISPAEFDILKGRTAHELVQAVSVIYPWGISTTRTVTFLRNNNAVIFREDSGWIAQSEGLFDFSFSWATGSTTNNYKNPFDIYPGLVQGLFDVKNIREDYSDVIKFNYNTETGDYYLDKATNTILQNVIKLVQVEFVAVYFDANVKLDALDKEITGKRFKGYLQVKPEGIPIPSRVLRDVLSKSQNAISGNIDVLLPVERTLQKFKANAVEISSSFENDLSKIIFVASVKGAVVLPPGGSWSVVEVDKTSGIVQNMKTGTSTGLVKDGLRPKINGHPFTLTATKPLLAFPDGCKNSVAKFSKTYGLLQNTDTQKLLLGALEFNKGQNDQFSSDPALLADCFRLMNSKGPFPNLKDAIQIDNVVKTVMKVGEDALSKVFQVEVPDNLPFDIIGKDGDDFHIYLKYSSIKKDGTNDKKSIIDYVTDSGSPEDKWSNLMQNMTIGVDLLVFKPIMYITGNFDNKKTGSPGLNSGTGPQLKLDSTLQKIYDLLEFLNNLDPTQPSEAVKKGLKIAMSNSADSWEYKFKAEKEIPLVKFPFDPINYNSPTTPLKMDAFFKMGVYFNQPIKIPNTIDQIKPSVGAFLELGAELRVMCVSVAAATIYAVGTAEVGLAADMNTPPSLYFKFGFGVQLAVGLPVIGSAAVTYMVGIDMKINSTELVVGAFIYFRGRVEIFGGIVTITISIEAAGKIQNKIGNGPTNCIAVCTFALDISIAFIIDISFTETWEETRQIS